MKKAHARILVGAAAAVSALGLAVPSASAATWTVSPANTAFTATQSGNLVMTSGSTTITCTAGKESGTTGDGSNAAALATLSNGSESGCTDSVAGGSWTVSLSGGSLAGSSYSNGVTTGTINGMTAKASGSDFGLGCSFTATGTLTATYTNSSATLKITGGTMTLSNVSGAGCGFAGIANGNTGSVTGAYVASPAITVTAS